MLSSSVEILYSDWKKQGNMWSRLVGRRLRYGSSSSWSSSTRSTWSSSSSTASTAADDKENDHDVSFCVDEVRRKDVESYVCGLYVPSRNAHRNAFFTLHAFHLTLAEASMPRSFVSTGEEDSLSVPVSLRLEWWKQTLDDCFARCPPSHPLARSLARTIGQFRLPRPLFQRILRKRQESPVQPHDLMTIENFAESIHSSMFALKVMCMSETPSGEALSERSREAISHLGKAVGLTMTARGVPVHAKNRMLFLPRSLTTKFGLIDENVFRFEDSEALRSTVFHVCDLAKAHLDEFRLKSGGLSRLEKKALLYSSVVEVYLDQLQKVQFNPFDPSLQYLSVPLQLRLMKNAILGRV